MKFIGIDLGWQSGASGVCGLALGQDVLKLENLECQATHGETLLWIDRYVSSKVPSMVAVDAPTLIPNQRGMRVPDRLAHRYYGRYHAGCYPANQGSTFAPKVLAFGQALEDRGFDHAPQIRPRTPGRYQIEVFPHPAMVRLFNLKQILKYKKGRLADRRSELQRLRSLILTHLTEQVPRLQVTHHELPTIPQKGAALKAVEDQLDSLVCAFVAAYWWYWGKARNHVMGGLETGYIIVPSPSGPPQD